MTPIFDALIFDSQSTHRKRLAIMTILCFVVML